MSNEKIATVVVDPNHKEFIDKGAKNVADIYAKYEEACRRAYKYSEDEHDPEVYMTPEKLERATYKQRKFTNYAVALGWVLGIDKDVTQYRCDCECPDCPQLADVLGEQ